MKLVLMHGLLGSPQMWRRVIDQVQPPDGALTLTLPGHGLSPWRAGATFEEVVDAMAERLPLGAPSLVVGYSLGARIALRLAARYPERIARALLIGVHPGFSEDAPRLARAAFDDGLAAKLEREGLVRFVEDWEKLPVFASQATLPPETRASRRSERLAHDPASIAWALRTLSLGRMPCHDDLSVIAPEVHLVTGALDEKFTAVNRALVRTSKRATHHVIENAGHDIALEAPQALAALISSLLRYAPNRADAHPTL